MHLDNTFEFRARIETFLGGSRAALLLCPASRSGGYEGHPYKFSKRKIVAPRDHGRVSC